MLIRPITAGDIEILDPCIMAAFGSASSYAPRLRRFLGSKADLRLVAEKDGRPVGTGGLAIFGKVGCIGLVAVDPAEQRRGIAAAIMKGLLGLAREEGCATILLDASDKGRPLYEKLGFVAEDLVGLWQREPRTEMGETMAEGAFVSTLAEASAPGPERIFAFDAEFWGADRKAVLASYIADDPALAALAAAPAKAAGDSEAFPEGRERCPPALMRGYAILQAETGILGPWLALDAETAAALLDWGIHARGEAPLSAYLPASNLEGERLLRERGFSLKKLQTHMRLGEPLPPDRRRIIYSQANFSFG